jgi:hypothetical protein
MIARRTAAAALAILLGGGCVTSDGRPRAGVAELAGEWRGRWLGAAGHAVTALAIEPDGTYRITMYLDGGDRASRGAIIALPSGRLRYQGADGNGDVRIGTADGVATLQFTPDGGGGSGAFRRIP